MLEENLKAVRSRIERAKGERRGTFITGDAVTLTAVTKNHPASAITSVQALGVMDIGENRVQEALAKKGQIEHKGTWHLIGHLQTNKARQAVEIFDIIESADSAHLLASIDRHAEAAAKKMDVLLQVNVAREEQKTGFSPEDFEEIIKHLSDYPSVNVRGVMVIAPETDDEKVLAEVFAKGYEDFCRLKDIKNDADTLSMGMSGDFEAAIRQGANAVRVGTALFGPRDYDYRGY